MVQKVARCKGICLPMKILKLGPLEVSFPAAVFWRAVFGKMLDHYIMKLTLDLLYIVV